MDISEIFQSMVFSDKVMRRMLPEKVYASLKKTMLEGTALDEGASDVIASTMKDWAISKGATHFTHWFQPMTGITAEKHDSFLTFEKDGSPIMEFSGKELIKGEPDASSFPSGGLRSTFEARGYTAWDPTSYAFVKDNTLYIPTAFCSFKGEILDKKTPLLRSIDALSKESCKILSLFGRSAKRVQATIGSEQEYFLISKDDYAKRLDLKLTGRTLLGAHSAKGQEKEDHYFGSIKPGVKAFMKELDEELWKLGVPSKTEHNEVAPSQHEMAAVFDNANKSCDENQITMEMMKKIAEKHGYACLLHEKPFEGINGSGKHNNWSIADDQGRNLLNPGKTPAENAEFMLLLTAVIKAVDDYQDLLRISVASAGNDHRLGANEAPPAIVSIFVGDELGEVISSIIDDQPLSGDKKKRSIDIGTSVLPKLPTDNSDRNRTSPFAFTGNKFEFRMPGSSFNTACINVMINTAVAESLRVFYDELAGAKDFNATLSALIRRELKAHQRIIFNGNGYSKEWEIEAEKRGLSNYKTTPEAVIHYDDEKNVALFAQHKIYTKEEIMARKEIALEEYVKTINIECEVMLEMLKKEVLPAVISFSKDLAISVREKEALGIDTTGEKALLKKIGEEENKLFVAVSALESEKENASDDVTKEAFHSSEKLIPLMEEARKHSDELEKIVGKEYWPFPTYSEMLFR